MAVSVDFAGITQALQSPGSVQDITVTKPANVAEGDIILFIHAADTGGSLVSPTSGPSVTWLPDMNGSGGAAAVCYLVAGPSEPSTYTFTWSGSYKSRALVAVRISGADTSGPFSGVQTVAASASDEWTSPTTVVTGGEVVAVIGAGQNAGATLTYPTSPWETHYTGMADAQVVLLVQTASVAGSLSVDLETSGYGRIATCAFVVVPAEGGDPEPPTETGAKIWDGTEWVVANIHTFDGSAWS